ncbi:MAG TPA: general stress protein [Chloroflexota bacterium]|jgi:hypothetical protein
MFGRGDHVIGVFDDGLSARDAIHALREAGFRGQDISILIPDADASREFATETGIATREGAATGALAGGVLGGLAGWLIGIGALAVPGVGPLLAAGALGAALSGAAIGAGVGAIAGALVGIGVPEDEAAWYEQEVRGGRALVSVLARDRRDQAREILRRFGAYDAESRRRAGGQEPTAGGARPPENDRVEGAR